MAMAQEDDEKAAQEARAERLRSKIGRITGDSTDRDQAGVSGDAATNAATNDAGEARPAQSDAGLDEQRWTGGGESPRDFIDRKMREEKEEGRKEEGRKK
jgi:DNA-binding protein H-NS